MHPRGAVDSSTPARSGAMLQCCDTAMLQYCNAAILQCCNTARHCSAVVRHAPRAAVNAAATDWSGLNFAQDFGFRGEAS